MSCPRFSIITATFNRASMLREALDSVVMQRRRDVEHVIVDGASTDGTSALLSARSGLRVVSEPDRGIYDAFNKGLALAQGEIVHFLNSDDLLVEGALDAIDAAFSAAEMDVVSGGVEFFEQDASGAAKVLLRSESESAMEFTTRQVLQGLPAINARFFRRRFIEQVGGFDLSYAIASDREFLLRAALLRPRSVVVPQLVYRYRSHAGSLTVHETDRNLERMRIEHVELCEKHLAQSGRDRSVLAAVHRTECASLAVDCIFSQRWSEARRWMSRGCAVSESWPLAFAKRLAGRALGRASRYALAPEGSLPR